MPVVSHSRVVYSAAPPSVAARGSAPRHALPVSPAASSAASHHAQSQPGPIHLPKDNFPLLHSLLDSPEYREAIAKDPALTRRPTARHSGEDAGAAKASIAQRKPSRSGAGVAELWSKVPRAASSVAGSFRSNTLRGHQRKQKQPAGWEVVDGPDAVETLSDEVWANATRLSGTASQVPPTLVAETPTSASAHTLPPAQITTLRPAPLLTSHSAPAPDSLPRTAAPATPSARAPRIAVSTPVLTSRSLPDLATTADVPSLKPYSPPLYPARAPAPNSLRSSAQPTRDRPSTAFASAVAQLKRMLVRSSRPSHASTRPGRSSRSPSFGADSTFSASTTFGDSGNGRPRATSELSFATVSLEGGFVDLGADQVVASPTSYTIQPNRTMQVAGPTQVADTLPSTLAASSAKPSPSAVASSPPRQFPTRHSSLLAASSDHSPQRLPISRATSPLPGSSSPTRASHRALSPRPAGRLTCMTPLSSSRRQTDVEMWRESCRQFLQVLRDGPAGAVPVAHAEGSSSGRRAAALRRDVAESSELSGLALPRARLPAQSSPRGTSSSSAPTSLSTSRGARTSLDGLGAPQGSYTSYGSRWEGSHSASAATVRGRRSLSVRRTPQPPVAVGGRAVNCGDEAEDERVWSGKAERIRA